MDKSRAREIIREYNLANWPADMLPDEWRVTDVGHLVAKAVADLTRGKEKGRKVFVRVGGQSGAGKSTQLVPMMEDYFGAMGVEPVMVMTRFFMRYHPFLEEIFGLVGEENLREATHEFAVQVLFESLVELIERGYPVVLDVSLADPKIEQVLAEMLLKEGYESELQMMAVATEISEEFVRRREQGGMEGKRKVRKETSEEFLRTTPLALKYYAEKMPEMRVVLWSAWDGEPVYVGRMGDVEMMRVWEKYQGIVKMPFETNEDELREAKKKWAKKNGAARWS